MKQPWYRRVAERLTRERRLKVIGWRDDHAEPYIYRYRWFESRLLSVYLHRIVRSDDSPDFHCHPWPFFHIILEGGYIEETIGRGACRIVARHVRPGWWAVHGPRYRHRIDLYTRVSRCTGIVPIEAWTLVVIGPKLREWGFWNRFTGCFTQWRQYVDGQRC